MTVNRRTLFRKLLSPDNAQAIADVPVRPPGAVSERAFIEACTRCGDCINACPEQVIVAGDGGYVEMNFRQTGCTSCGRCIEACSAGVLRPLNSQRIAGSAHISGSCLPKHQVSCQSCRDICDQSAIRFDFSTATPAPEADIEACNGCGFCVAVCPVGSIHIQSQPELRGTL
ncbi:ferredoxin-type protein NapF [Reinekea marinisedimentorum]|uniref:Ferredoxin-type protein NapF n=1 Tax=Reinekea marinisedimentorum TaxID=230495 RepID=A0A4R3I5B3_9GAMM|nr:ferredoxin-type protein NapF [Reinekea marinisedimentorum]TCS40133.1 ferredoxin-type protein NapF [Reinekea marinisedimentorum]